MSELRRWRRERFRLPTWGGAATFLAAMAVVARGSSPGGIGFARNLLVALLGLAALRLWDDLADRLRDTGRFPDRVLCRTARLRTFKAALALLLGLETLLFAALGHGWTALAVWLGILAALTVYYRVTALPDDAERALGPWRLGKYPALVVALAALDGPPPGLVVTNAPARIAVVAALVWLAWLRLDARGAVATNGARESAR